MHGSYCLHIRTIDTASDRLIVNLGTFMHGNGLKQKSAGIVHRLMFNSNYIEDL